MDRNDPKGDQDETQISSSEDFSDEIADVEEYAKTGKVPPECRGYLVKINGEPYVFHDRFVTGRQVLERASLLPPESYLLRLKQAGERPKKVELDAKVDLRRRGIEKFKALPRDQTEGGNGSSA